ncbi:secreted RxLR effector protein 161-like [Rutidosis leptorrhynchoides]|uniref:secreted RxLR effector protein 161-like n=1 Tax=Rutidosis leptorrhynchoides TaxID=125765 RepID=UPI003A9A33FF
MAQIPYTSVVGSIMYAMICSRPNIAYAVGVVSQFMPNPGKEHWEGIKWLLRYLKGISKMGLQFTKGDSILRGYVDADLGGCDDSGRSTTGYVFTVGKTAVSWMSKLQSCVALSTTEAEYMAAAEACKELVWLKNFMLELGLVQQDYALYYGTLVVKKIPGTKNPADMCTKVVTMRKLKLCIASTGLLVN